MNSKLFRLISRNRILNGIRHIVRQNPILFNSVREVRDCFTLIKGVVRRSFSQHGEDQYLLNRFTHSSGFYVDIGASHPFRISNTFMLYHRGWEGLTVEPIPWLGKLHRRWRSRDILVEKAIGLHNAESTYYEMMPSVLSTLDEDVADALVSSGRAEVFRETEIDVITINELFEDYVGDRKVDFLSIDIEGLDVEVIQGLDFVRFRPEVISIEVNIPSQVRPLLSFFEDARYGLIDKYGCNVLLEDLGL